MSLPAPALSMSSPAPRSKISSAVVPKTVSLPAPVTTPRNAVSGPGRPRCRPRGEVDVDGAHRRRVAHGVQARPAVERVAAAAARDRVVAVAAGRVVGAAVAVIVSLALPPSRRSMPVFVTGRRARRSSPPWRSSARAERLERQPVVPGPPSAALAGAVGSSRSLSVAAVSGPAPRACPAGPAVERQVADRLETTSLPVPSASVPGRRRRADVVAVVAAIGPAARWRDRAVESSSRHRRRRGPDTVAMRRARPARRR